MERVISAAVIRSKFQKNLRRVRHLLEVFRTLHPGQERPSELHADVVRAAILFLHATLEDLLRSGEELRFPQAPAAAFKRLQWVRQIKGEERTSEKLGLEEFAAAFRGQTVDEVLMQVFQKHHERSNYNNQQDVVGALERMGLDTKPFEEFFPDLHAMMKRRHEIAHRADINRRLPQMTNRVIVKVAERWLQTVEAFGNRLVTSLQEKP